MVANASHAAIARLHARFLLGVLTGVFCFISAIEKKLSDRGARSRLDAALEGDTPRLCRLCLFWLLFQAIA